eukprot:1613405-Amphidinium_carterae.4
MSCRQPLVMTMFFVLRQELVKSSSRLTCTTHDPAPPRCSGHPPEANPLNLCSRTMLQSRVEFSNRCLESHPLAASYPVSLDSYCRSAQ